MFIICLSYHISSVIKGLSDWPEALQITVKRLVLNFRCLSQVLLQMSKLKCVSNILIRRTQLYQKARWRSHYLQAKQKNCIVNYIFGYCLQHFKVVPSFCRVKRWI